MIKNQNRSKWFGASDTDMVVGNWNTDTFKEWWSIKLGYKDKGYHSWIMDCGNIMEIPIIRFIEKKEGRKIAIGKHPYYRLTYRLRVNYDGLRKDEVVEIKTTEKFWETVPKKYWRQCQVLMYRKRKKKTGLYAYRMESGDYASPYFPIIDEKRLKRYEIDYDEYFIENEYKPRLKYLASCLRAKKYPTEKEYEQIYSKDDKKIR